MLKTNNRWLWLSIGIVALIGLADATYLTVHFYTGEPPTCIIGDGCVSVTTSEYAAIQGIPVSLLGMLFYLTITGLTASYIDRARPQVPMILVAITTLGLLFTVYLTSLQAWVINAWCPYCLLSATTSTILWILALCAYKKTSRPQPLT